MSITAFIMLRIESRLNRVIFDKISALPEAEEAYLLFGAYDIIIKCIFKSNEDLNNFVVDVLGAIDGIEDTLTNVCASCN